MNKSEIQKIIDERDGLTMRVQALEAKINGQAKQIEYLQKGIRLAEATAGVAERFAIKIARISGQDFFNLGRNSALQNTPAPEPEPQEE